MGTVVDAMDDALNGSDITGHERRILARWRLSSTSVSSTTGSLPLNLLRQRPDHTRWLLCNAAFRFIVLPRARAP